MEKCRETQVVYHHSAYQSNDRAKLLRLFSRPCDRGQRDQMWAMPCRRSHCLLDLARFEAERRVLARSDASLNQGSLVLSLHSLLHALGLRLEIRTGV